MALSIRNPEADRLADELMEIADRFAGLPEYDSRSAAEILGYDENGLPT